MYTALAFMRLHVAVYLSYTSDVLINTRLALRARQNQCGVVVCEKCEVALLSMAATESSVNWIVAAQFRGFMALMKMQLFQNGRHIVRNEMSAVQKAVSVDEE